MYREDVHGTWYSQSTLQTMQTLVTTLPAVSPRQTVANDGQWQPVRAKFYILNFLFTVVKFRLCYNILYCSVNKMLRFFGITFLLVIVGWVSFSYNLGRIIMNSHHTILTLLCPGGGTECPPLRFCSLEPSRVIWWTPNVGTIHIGTRQISIRSSSIV